MLRLVSQLPIYSNLSLKRPGNILVPLNLVGRISKILQVELQTSLLLHLWPQRWSCPFPYSSSCLLFKYTFSCRHFVPSAVPQTLYVLCTLLVSAHLVVVYAGVVCSLPSMSWQVGCPSSQRGEEARLSLHTEISNFLTSGAVALVLLHCLPTETDSSDYCVHSERSRKNITSSLCLRRYSFYSTDSAR